MNWAQALIYLLTLAGWVLAFFAIWSWRDEVKHLLNIVKGMNSNWTEFAHKQNHEWTVYVLELMNHQERRILDERNDG